MADKGITRTTYSFIYTSLFSSLFSFIIILHLLLMEIVIQYRKFQLIYTRENLAGVIFLDTFRLFTIYQYNQ